MNDLNHSHAEYTTKHMHGHKMRFKTINIRITERTGMRLILNKIWITETIN